MSWRLEGWDSFAHHKYTFSGEYVTEEEARVVAAQVLAKIQSFKDSGGPPEQGGIQDMVFVVRPDGTKYRFSAEGEEGFEKV